MRKHPNPFFERPAPEPTGRRMMRAGQLLAALTVGTLLMGGCTKKAPEAAVPAPVTAASTNVNPALVGQAPVPAGAVQVVATAPEGGADLKELNHAYIRWVIQNRRHAKTVEEFAASSGISIPAAPAGKKYIIDKAGFIALVNQ